jgi:hypothetical protein
MTLITDLKDERIRELEDGAKQSMELYIALKNELAASVTRAEEAMAKLCKAESAWRQYDNTLSGVDRMRSALSTSSPCPHEAKVLAIACGPRLDPSKCSGCNGTGIGNCICGGMGTVEAERDGYKVAALERLRAALAAKEGK